ncbi:MAG: DUF2934 domain-containing protein [Chromatiales bacterium]|nr:DUF2934 domain-containing protein [Chromatiales bacterium]
MAKTKTSGRNPATTSQSTADNPGTPISEVERQRLIAENAYYRAQQRGFNGGEAIDDWLDGGARDQSPAAEPAAAEAGTGRLPEAAQSDVEPSCSTASRRCSVRKPSARQHRRRARSRLRQAERVHRGYRREGG